MAHPTCGWIVGWGHEGWPIPCSQPVVVLEDDHDGDTVILCRQHAQEFRADRDDQPRTADDV